MRFLLLLMTGLSIAACSPGSDGGNSTSQAPKAGAAQPTLGEEPATSASAKAARDVVDRYFKAIDQHDYAAAYGMWGGKGADTRGTLDQFEATFKPYSEYRQKVGEPTAIKVADGRQYILVTATIDVKNRTSGKTAHREGTVMLRRSANPSETDPEQRDWRIWGTDIRVQH